MAHLGIADAHVDVLWRMDNEKYQFYGQDTPLQASYERLARGGVITQVFALYVSAHLSGPVQLESVLRAIDIFQRHVVKDGYVRHVKNQTDLALAREHNELAGVLSLEGAGCLSGNPDMIRLLFQLGVRGVGLTWNPANEFADGCREARGAGLTQAGFSLVRELERLGMWVDIAHLADAGVNDILRAVDGPVMASHANARAVHQHPRNLTDDVIREMIRRNGWIGLTFEGSFIEVAKPATLEGVFRHLDHILDLGGDSVVGLGSDFDGTSNPVVGLCDASDYRNFGEAVMERYGERLGAKILFGNFERFLRAQLPSM